MKSFPAQEEESGNQKTSQDLIFAFTKKIEEWIPNLYEKDAVSTKTSQNLKQLKKLRKEIEKLPQNQKEKQESKDQTKIQGLLESFWKDWEEDALQGW
jgi:hypothetical protein